MSTATAIPTSTREQVRDLVSLVEQGRILEAFDAYYADGVVMQENRNAPTVGKGANRAREEQFVGAVAEVHENRAKSVVVDGERSVIEWVLDFTNTEGQRVRLEQVSVQEWEGGRIVRERFFYDSAALGA